MAYGEGIGPPLTWPRDVNGPWREQCDDDRVLEVVGAEGLEFGGVEIGEADTDIF